MFKMIDLLGPEIKLNINSSSRFKTVFGAWLTIFLILLAFGAFLGFGNDIFFRMMPKVTFNRVINQEVAKQNITSRNFLFAIYDQFSNLPIPDFDRRYIVYFDYRNVTPNGNIDLINPKNTFEKCAPEVLSEWKSYFATVSPDLYRCFLQNQTYELSGVLTQGIYTRTRLQVDYCVNNTNPAQGPIRTNCIPKEETLALLAGKRIQMHYIIESSIIDTLNYTNPVYKTAYTGYVNTDPLSWARLTVFYKSIITDTDQGFITQSNEVLSTTAIESIVSESIYSPSGSTIFSHLIGNSRYKETYTRTYIKIQDIFAMMGGFINAGLIILRFTVSFFKTPDMVDLFNSITKYKNLEQKEQLEKDPTEKKIFYGSVRPLNLNKMGGNSNMINYLNEKPETSLNKSKLEGNTNVKQNELSKNALMMSDIEGGKRPVPLKMFNENKLDQNTIANTLNTLSKRNYSFKSKLRCRTFRVCCPTSKSRQRNFSLFDEIEKKMNKTMSLENLSKMTKFNRFLQDILLEKYQRNIFNLCMYSKTDEGKENNLQIQGEKFGNALKNQPSKIDLVLLEYLNKEGR